MVSNEIIMPALLKFFRPGMNRRTDLSYLLLSIRRVAIFVVLLTAYGFYRMAGEDYSLTAFGLLSFAAAAQFGPALVGGIIWRRGNYGRRLGPGSRIPDVVLHLAATGARHHGLGHRHTD